jgi:tetratricopeptide (TPR) repeat protein
MRRPAGEGGDLAGAKARYEQYLEITERLARDNPGSASAQRDLSISYNSLGDVLREGGDLAGVKARYEEGLEISERLARDNPGSAAAQILAAKDWLKDGAFVSIRGLGVWKKRERDCWRSRGRRDVGRMAGERRCGVAGMADRAHPGTPAWADRDRSGVGSDGVGLCGGHGGGLDCGAAV